MLRFVIFCAGVVLSVSCSAVEPRLTVNVTIPATEVGKDLVYLASNLNGWNPGDPQFALKKNGSVWTGSFRVPAGYSLQYKFTRGGWDKVEKDAAGHEMGNREWTATADQTLGLVVDNWADQVSGGPAASTVTGIVDLVEDYPLPPAGGKRLLRVRLPFGYATSGQSYRVLYMLDAQNLFDDTTSFVGEWHVDETLTTAEANQSLAPTIVVGIDNAGSGRQNEYSPYFDGASPLPGGKTFADYLVTTLKPWVDANYRTLPDQSQTGIAGSSMGGLIALYAALSHPGIFGQVGSFSGAFWFGNNALARELRATRFDPRAKVYLDVGTRESGSVQDNARMVSDSREIAGILTQQGLGADRLKLLVVEGAAHNEAAWAPRLGPALQWLDQP